MTGKPKLAAVFAAVFIGGAAFCPVQAAENLLRGEVIDAMVGLTQDPGWTCSSKDVGSTEGCQRLRATLVRFFRDGDDLFVESLVRANGNWPVRRLVMTYSATRWDWPQTPIWELMFQLESYSNSTGYAHPMLMRCQPESTRQFRCSVSEGARYADNSNGFRNYVLTWSR